MKLLNPLTTLFGSSAIIYIIIAALIPIIILLIYLKTCKISNHIQVLRKEQEYTNEFLIKQIEQNDTIIELLKSKTK